jgi:hypothetical protein
MYSIVEFGIFSFCAVYKCNPLPVCKTVPNIGLISLYTFLGSRSFKGTVAMHGFFALIKNSKTTHSKK